MRILRWPFFKTISVAAVLLLPAAHSAFCLQGAQAKPAATATAPSDAELADIREQLIALLRMSPTLTEVVETDPSLLADQEYVSRTNPQLAQFLAQHPEVSRNPDFYLFAELPRKGGRYIDGLRRRVNGNPPPTDEQVRQQNIHSTMSDLMATLMFAAGAGAFLWLVRMLLESRRWTRVFRLQSETHTKLIDRFANNQELLNYMETEPGKRFLEAAPIPIDFGRDQHMPGGLSRILGPLQLGIVLTLLGAGLIILHQYLTDQAHQLLVFGVVAMMPGLGFIISALITWRMSVRLGLLPQGPQPSTEPSDRQ